MAHAAAAIGIESGGTADASGTRDHNRLPFTNRSRFPSAYCSDQNHHRQVPCHIVQHHSTTPPGR
ncbi:uncharacterized protein CTRU02_213682 [Colletotrichum truncatum]|uniref:Uncharacterized protein n=1 Tax=Colletotrichum truncatum TaxID=5467 RepID=A0ACC3YHV0_COLTU|nr:uncharacterized protein CTRU02_11745 [Colletotrichum truncatum]KAF6785445.1 hypothetical protein CTRU02_11745 [Colletotrichum truncatum]